MLFETGVYTGMCHVGFWQLRISPVNIYPTVCRFMLALFTTAERIWTC